MTGAYLAGFRDQGLGDHDGVDRHVTDAALSPDRYQPRIHRYIAGGRETITW